MESDNAPLSDDGLDSKPAATGSPTTAAAAHSEISRDRTDEPSLQLVPPKDVCGGAWLMFLVMGVGLLFPWNAILQATDFFLSQFPCSAIEFDLSVAYMASVLVTVVVALVIMNYCKSITAVARVSVGFVFMLASLFTYGIAGDSIAYQPAVWTTVASGVGDGLAQTGLYGMSSTLPPKYTTATMIGNGVSGVIVTILRIATKKAFPAGKEGLLASTDMYFYIAASFVVLCIICVATIECVPIVKFYRQVNSSVDAKTEDNVQNNRTPSSHARAVVLALLEDQRADSARYGGIDNSEFHESQMDRNVYSSERRSKSVGMAPIRGSTAPLLSSNSLSSSRHNSTSVSTNSLEVPPPISGGFLAPDRTHNAFLRDRAVTAPVKKAYPAWRSRRRIEVDFVQRARAFSQRAVSFGPGRRSFVASFSTTPQLSDDGIPEPNHCRCGDCCGPHKCRFFYILAQMKHHAAIVFLTFFLTLSLYPGEVLEIPATNFSNSTPGLLQEAGWFPVLIIGTFNVGDLVGRFIPFCEKAVIDSPGLLWLLTASRFVIIIPLILLMVYEVIRSDVVAFATVTFMSISNGFLSTIAMMLGPQQLPKADRELGGSIMVFCLLSGLTAGALVGMALGAAKPSDC